MKYESTALDASGRIETPVSIETAIANGMPPGGGLYVPSEFPRLPDRIFDPEPLAYTELAWLVLAPFFPAHSRERLHAILKAAYGASDAALFDTPDIAPLGRIALRGNEERPAPELYLLELSHGPTCAFKDLALSVLGGLLKMSLDSLGRKEPVLVLTATSGDTGSAALAGLSRVEGVGTAVLYPRYGTSDIQRLQMTTVDSPNVFVAGVEGNFDDAQRAVKKAFARAARGEGPLAGFFLSSANSINIGRLLPQIVYYVAAWRALAAGGSLGPSRTMNVSVPTGNFGDILAAKYAKEMGLPVGRMICASNANNVLADFFATGAYDRRRDLVKTQSPSMDILVSSNLERLLYLASGRDPSRVSSLMAELSGRGWFELSKRESEYMADFSGGWCSDGSARSAIAEIWDESGVLVDPHTATAAEVGRRSFDALDPTDPLVVVSTASPFKFPRAVLEALSEAGLASPDILEDGRAGDLELAAYLEQVTGARMPAPIASLKGKAVAQAQALALDEVEGAFARFAASFAAGQLR